MHYKRFGIELSLASAITNFRIMSTTFIIIDLRGFFHSPVFCVTNVNARKIIEKSEKKNARDKAFKDINEHKNDT